MHFLAAIISVDLISGRPGEGDVCEIYLRWGEVKEVNSINALTQRSLALAPVILIWSSKFHRSRWCRITYTPYFSPAVRSDNAKINFYQPQRSCFPALVYQKFFHLAQWISLGTRILFPQYCKIPTKRYTPELVCYIRRLACLNK